MEKILEKEIWVYVDLRNRRLFDLSLNVLAKAREIAELVSGKTVALILGFSNADKKDDVSTVAQAGLSFDFAANECISHGADFVYVMDNEKLTIPRADIHASVLANTVQRRNPMLVIFALTDFARELAARTARITNAGLISRCMDIKFDGDSLVAKCHSWGGEVMADIVFDNGLNTGFMTMQLNAFRHVEPKGEPGVVEWIPIDNVDVPENPRLLSRAVETDKKQHLEDAKVVVVGGAGLQAHENFGLVRELAAALGGELGATRPPVLQHWVDEERLIGQTGKTVRPNLLFSIGTSGAVQYTAGIMESKTIVAINRDRNSPIFQAADIGIVADAKTFLPLFITKVRNATVNKMADVMHGTVKTSNGNGFGRRVRKLRESRNWTMGALAQAACESPEFIERIENDEVTPPVSFLLKLAGVLDVDAGTFLRRDSKRVVRNMRTQAFIKRTQNYSYQTLSPGDESDHMHAFMVTVEPNQMHKPVAYKHDGEEFLFVMEGDLRLTVGNKVHRLGPNESIHFKSHIPHKLKSISNKKARCIVVLYTP